MMERTPEEGWRPDTVAMDCWRTATWRLYQVPDDAADAGIAYITMPDFRHWPLLTPEEDAHIISVIQKPWIPDGAAIEGVSVADIPMADLLLGLAASDGHDDDSPAPGGGAVTVDGAMSRSPQQQTEAPALLAAALVPALEVRHQGFPSGNPLIANRDEIHVRHTHHHVWNLLDDVARPMLLWDEPFALRALLEPPPPRLSAVPAAAALALRLLAAAAADAEVPTSAPPAPNLPKHVADLVIRDAETRGATCPITMEPITAVSATVTSCGHVFQTAALTHWLTSNTTCPECRRNIIGPAQNVNSCM